MEIGPAHNVKISTLHTEAPATVATRLQIGSTPKKFGQKSMSQEPCQLVSFGGVPLLHLGINFFRTTATTGRDRSHEIVRFGMPHRQQPTI